MVLPFIRTNRSGDDTGGFDMQEKKSLLRRRIDQLIFVLLAAAAVCQVLILASGTQAMATALKMFNIGSITVHLTGSSTTTLAWVAFVLVAISVALAIANERMRLLITLGASVLFFGQLFGNSLPSVDNTAYPWVAGVALAFFTIFAFGDLTGYFPHKNVSTGTLTSAGRAS